MSAAAGTLDSLQDHDPFGVLLNANTVLLHNLRRDDATPELQKQLTTTGMPPSAQAYFCDPYTNSYLGPQIRPKAFAMLPEPLARERDRVECMSFMGLLPEIDHAWMTVDNVLFLWNYHTQNFTQFRDLEQVIVTVALVPPRKGVFQDSVKHVLAVATTVEVILLAVTYEGEQASGNGSCRNRRIQVRQTNFRASTDGISMLKITGHPNGRILMAGKDGSLYELGYSVAYGFMYHVFYMGNPSGTRKCERLVHKSSGGTSGSSPVKSVLALFGYRSAERTLIDVVVDPLRNVLYTLDLDGRMDLFDLGADGNQTTQKMIGFDLWEAAYKFCRWGATSTLLPDQSIFKGRKRFQVVSLGVVDPTESKDISLIAVSDAGMRFYLSCGYSGGKARTNVRLSLVQIRCPPPEPLWRYLHHKNKNIGHQSLGQSNAAGTNSTNSGNANTSSVNPSPSSTTIVASNGPARSGAGAVVVPPPPLPLGTHTEIQPPDGFPAKWERQASASPSVYDAYCCGGVTVLAQVVGDGDRLVLIGPDLVTRSKRRREAHQEEHPWMREAVSEIGGPGTGESHQPRMGKVWAISERPVALTDSPDGARVRSLLVTSKTPSQADINAASGNSPPVAASAAGAYGNFGGRSATGIIPTTRSGRTSTAITVTGKGGVMAADAGGAMNRMRKWMKRDYFPPRPVAPGPPLVASPGGSSGFGGGLMAKDLGKVVALPELGTQPYSSRREMLCLTSAGLHTLSKLRPVDLLYDLLAQNQMERVSLFFDDFSPDQSAAMCFSIASGLPRDMSSGITDAVGGGDNGLLPLGAPSQIVRARALDAAVLNCKPPGFTSPQAAGGAGGAGAGVAMEGVTMGEKFNNSALHNGLQLFIARLLRPFWFLPVVTVPLGGGTGAGGGGGSGSKRSADGSTKSGTSLVVPTFVRDLDALRAPLESLRISIRAAFPRAVSEDLAALAGKEARAAAATAAAAAAAAAGGGSSTTGNPSDRQTVAFGSSGHGVGGGVGAGRGGAAGGPTILSGRRLQQHKPETPQQRHMKALKREALEVHAAYRLVSRAAEAVRMAGILACAARDFPRAKLSWSALDGVPLWRLCSGRDEHRRASSLLADLVGPKGNLPTDARNVFARELGITSATFFSQGDRRTFEGVELLRRAGEAHRGPGGTALSGTVLLTAEEEASARQGAALLIEAAKEWRGERALGADGQLQRACAALSGLGRLEAVVDVCMTCAKNFSAKGGGGSISSGSGGIAVAGATANRGALGPYGSGGGVDGAAAAAVQPWEEGMYQGGGVVGAAQREKARLECYGKVLDTVVGLLRRPTAAAVTVTAMTTASVAVAPVGGGSSKKVEALIARCLSYGAPQLDQMLYSLLENEDKSLLLAIKTPGVEVYLQKDPDLLFRHYMLHKEYPKAVYLMDREAHVEAHRGVHVRDRVGCLLKAISACYKCDLDASQMVAPGWNLNHAKLRSLEDERDVLLTQERLLRDLEGSMAPLERLVRDGRGTEYLDTELSTRSRMVEEWKTSIVDPTELYRQASSVFLWEGCLQLLQCCEVDEPMVSRKLIRSIIWREMPRSSVKDGRAQDFIDGGRDRPGELEVDDVRWELDSDPKADVVSFEDDGWFAPLMDKMMELTREMLSHKANFVLPVDTLCLELQRISDAYYESDGPAKSLCVVQAVRQAGVSPAALLDAYEYMNRNYYPKGERARLRRLEVMVELLRWTSQEDKPGLYVETVRPERLERLAQDTHTGLDSLQLSSGVWRDPEDASIKVDALKRQLETLLQALHFPRTNYR